MAQQTKIEEYLLQIEGLLGQKRLKEAANDLINIGEDIGFLLIDRASTNEKMLQAIAQLFYMVNDYHKAAVCCEQLQEFEKAAILYERAKVYEMAAEMYSKIDRPLQAAAMFEKYGEHAKAAELYLEMEDFERAAQNYDKIGDNFQAGRLFNKCGRPLDAIKFLQKVPFEHEQYLEAVLIIVKILIKAQREDLAVRKLWAVLEARDIDDSTVEHYYILGYLLRKVHKLTQAVQVFGRIVEFDISYKDAADQLHECEQLAKQAESSEKPVAAKLDFFAGPNDEEEQTAVITSIPKFDKVPLKKRIPEAYLLVKYQGKYNKTYELKDRDAFLVGRNPGLCDIVLPGDDVSQTHAQLYFKQHFYLEDLDSTNGTFVNDDEIHEPKKLEDKDTIHIGDTQILFVLNTYQTAKRNVLQDELTAAYNKPFFDATIKHLYSGFLRHATPFAVIIWQIDPIKDDYDNLKLEYVDAVALHVAESSKTRVREADYFCRLEQFDFALILPATSFDQAQTIAGDIAEKISEEPLELPDESHTLTARFGVGVARDDLSSAEEVFQQALENIQA